MIPSIGPMELAVVQLGGHPVTILGEEAGIDTRETAEDIARVLSRYHTVIAARVFDHAKLERLAAAASVPVVNLLSDDAHPCQALADLLTLYEHFGDTGVLRRQYDSARAWVDLVERLAGPDRLWNSGYQLGDWLDPAAPPEDPAERRRRAEEWARSAGWRDA